MSDFSKKRRFNRMSVNVCFWHKPEIRRSSPIPEKVWCDWYATRGYRQLQ